MQTMTPPIQEQSATVADKYTPKFERFAKRTAGPAWLAALRQTGIARFSKLGLPTLDQSGWHTLETHVGDGSLHTCTDAVGAATQRFYRLRVE